MNCEECQPLLEELFDGEADREAAHRARAHLASCADCADAFDQLRREQELYLRYEFDEAPAPEAFWPQVLARAANASASDTREHVSHAPSGSLLRARLRAFVGAFATPRFSPTLTAALVLCAVALTVIVTRYTDTRRQTTAEVVSVEQPAPEAHARADSSTSAGAGASSSSPGTVAATVDEVRRGTPASVRRESASKKARVVRASGTDAAQARASLETPDQLVREAEQKYLAAIRLLSHDVRRNRARLDPQTAARFERTLATIDRTIAGTRRAVRQHPGDPVAVNYMLAAYARKVEVLREMASY
jgi:hypothetical protein